MLKLDKTENRYRLVKGSLIVSSWYKEKVIEDFSSELTSFMEFHNETPVVILSKDEYKYLLDCEDMLFRMQEMLRVKIEEAKS